MYSPDGGVVSYNKWGWSNWYEENTKATYACGFGYKKSGADSSICLASGNWSQPRHTCTEGICVFPILY